jgi:hypothetical protein
MTPHALSRSLTLVLAVSFAVAPSTTAQTNGPAPAAVEAGQAAASDSAGATGFGVGFALRASTTGLGVEGAVRLHRRLNARVGFNRFTYSHDFDDESDITYTGQLTLQSVAAYLDWFPFGGGFHVSPGLTISNRNELGFSATVPAGETISVDDVDYLSTAANPIRTAGAVTVASTRPALLIGWGNLVPRTRRFSVPFELGVIFQGTPTGGLTFTGTGCAPNGQNCRNMATDPTVQGHVQNEVTQLNEELGRGVLRFYPVLSIGVAVRF